ncbi:hypothetical protein, partial [Filifactor villosus]
MIYIDNSKLYCEIKSYYNIIDDLIIQPLENEVEINQDKNFVYANLKMVHKQQKISLKTGPINH